MQDLNCIVMGHIQRCIYLGLICSSASYDGSILCLHGIHSLWQCVVRNLSLAKVDKCILQKKSKVIHSHPSEEAISISNYGFYATTLDQQRRLLTSPQILAIYRTTFHISLLSNRSHLPPYIFNLLLQVIKDIYNHLTFTKPIQIRFTQEK